MNANKLNTMRVIRIPHSHTYPKVPLPGIGGLGGFCVGGVVRDRPPIFMFWLLTCDNYNNSVNN